MFIAAVLVPPFAQKWRRIPITINVFFLFLFVALVFGRFSLQSPHISDDLHLLRTYTTDELLSVWTGTWDPDGIENPGFRPFTTYFYHILHQLTLGSIVAQRVILLALFSLLLTSLGWLCNYYWGISYRITVLGGLIGLFHIANVSHYAWITDGIYLISALLLVVATGSLLQWLHSKKAIWLVVSGIAIMASLLVREDSLVVIPLLFLALGVSYFTKRDLFPSAKQAIVIGASSIVLVALLGLWWYWRNLAVPNAVPIRASLSGLVWSVMQTGLILGDETRLIIYWPWWLWITYLWMICLGGLAAICVFLLDQKTRLQTGLWIVAVVIASMPGLTLSRTNLLLLPTIFFGYAVATVLLTFSKRSITAYVISVGIALFALTASVFGSYVLQRERVSSSIDYLCGITEWLYGTYAHATIPEDRLDEVRSNLARVGIHSLADRDRVIPALIAEAKSNRRYTPSAEGNAFIPRLRFLVSPNWRAWSCVGREGWVFP